MKTKKFLATALAGMMLALAPATGIGSSLVPSLGLHGPSIAYAAKGGARIAPSAPKSAPAASKATSPDTHKSVAGNGGSYAPSRSAKDLGKDAPAANGRTNAAAGTTNPGTNANAQSGSRLGSVLRGVGLLAGGMFLGSMLGNMLGFGGGILSDMLGVLVNIVLFVIAFAVLRALLGRFLGRKRNDPQAAWNQQPRYDASRRSNADANGPLHTIDVTPADSRSTYGGHPLNGQDAKSIADKYRNL